MQSGFLNSFPFDPLSLNSPANEVKEIKNGRLAMVILSPQHHARISRGLAARDQTAMYQAAISALLQEAVSDINDKSMKNILLSNSQAASLGLASHMPPAILGKNGLLVLKKGSSEDGQTFMGGFSATCLLFP